MPNPVSHTKYGYAIGDAVVMANAGAPDETVGAGVAGIGSICMDTTNGKLYVNGGTKATPAWKLVTSAS